jgi:pantetheine-phosphate adenylyltransferase
MAPDPRKAIVPGSYDPVTYGHLDVIERAAGLFDSIIVGVVNLPVRKGTTLFTAEERCGFIADAARDLKLDNVAVKPFSNLLVEFAQDNDARAIVKGLRAISDFEYEFEMNQLNRMQAPDVESIYLMSSPRFSFLSSSGVRELATFGGNIDDLVPASVATALKERLGR